MFAEMRKLSKRREELRFMLKDYFSLPVSQRNYKEFESIVDELEELRRRIRELKQS